MFASLNRTAGLLGIAALVGSCAAVDPRPGTAELPTRQPLTVKTIDYDVYGCLDEKSVVMINDISARINAASLSQPDSDRTADAAIKMATNTIGKTARQSNALCRNVVIMHDTGNARSVALVEQFISRGVAWEQPAERMLPPLHLAVLHHSEDLVKRLLAAGANPRTKMVAPGKPLDGLDAFDLARFLRTSGDRVKETELVKGLLRLEALLCDDKSVNARARTKDMPKVSIDPKTHRMLGYRSFFESYLYAADNAEQIPLGRDSNPPPKPSPSGDPEGEGFTPTEDDAAGIWGAIGGPLGDQKDATIGFASVWEYDNMVFGSCKQTHSAAFYCNSCGHYTNADGEGDDCAPSADLQGTGTPPGDAQIDDWAHCAWAPSSLEANLRVVDVKLYTGDLFKAFKLASRRSRPEKEARLLRLKSVSIQDVDKDGQFEVLVSADFAFGCGGKPYTEDFVLKVASDLPSGTQPSGSMILHIPMEPPPAEDDGGGR
jgi:hypothetical protein